MSRRHNINLSKCGTRKIKDQVCDNMLLCIVNVNRIDLDNYMYIYFSPVGIYIYILRCLLIQLTDNQ